MKTSDFHYHLPPEQIAQQSVEPRDSSRLLVVSRSTDELVERTFAEISEFLRPGDVLVRNVSRVFKARLEGVKESNGVRFELFVLEVLEDSLDGVCFSTLIKPGKKVNVGDRIAVGSGDEWTSVKIEEKHEDGRVAVTFLGMSASEVIAFCDEVGHIPVPPYVGHEPTDIAQYQTVYACETGSVAAPTAGFHFTDRLIAELEAKGIIFVDVILHVGIGTFRPVKTEHLEDHIMHAEYVEIPQETVDVITLAKQEGRRVIAVGTTTVRALEGVVLQGKRLKAYAGPVNIFITPGFQFSVIDGLITNFHLPESTLIVLVSAFLGREKTMRIYEHAVKAGFRFFSFGDAMLIL